MITARAFSGKHYMVLGLARSGMAVVESLLASGARVTAWDRQLEPREALAGRAEIADPLEIPLEGFDAIVVSPGVPLNTHPLVPRAKAAGVPIIGDIELFAQAQPELPEHFVVGITGTNGKSTTTALVHHILKSAGVSTIMGGNIGLPIMAQQPLEANDAGLPVYVLELSSYQIDLTYSLKCKVAALLNITPDHLDRYENFAAYAAAKARLLWMLDDFGVALLPESAAHLPAIAALRGANAPFEWLGPDFDDAGQADWPTLQGPHNLENAAFAARICGELFLSNGQVATGLRTYPGLPHRMERVTTRDGVLYVNDSKATNPASTAPALAAFQPEEGRKRIHWICGGLAKEDNLDDCAPHFGNVACAYTIGEAGALFTRLLEPHMPVEPCELLAQAVNKARQNAVPGDVVMLSPACASFDQFRDYEIRGDTFKELVAQLCCDGDREACGLDEPAGEAGSMG